MDFEEFHIWEFIVALRARAAVELWNIPSLPRRPPGVSNAGAGRTVRSVPLCAFLLLHWGSVREDTGGGLFSPLGAAQTGLGLEASFPLALACQTPTLDPWQNEARFPSWVSSRVTPSCWP